MDIRVLGDHNSSHRKKQMGGLVVVDGQSALLRVGGRSLLERKLEMLRREACSPFAVVCDDDLVGEVRQVVTTMCAGCRVVAATDSSELASLVRARARNLVVVVHASFLLDQRLVHHAVARTEPAAYVDGRPPENLPAHEKLEGKSFIGLATLAREDLAHAFESGSSPLDVVALLRSVADLPTVDVEEVPRYSPSLRRPLRPYWMPVHDRADAARARKQLIAACGKGKQEWFIYAFNKPIELFLMNWVCEWRITPNQLTFLGNVTGWTTTALFALGHFWSGIAAALVTTIFDGLDGRQARIQIKTSRVGEYEHYFDALFEISWIVALGWHFSDGFSDVRYVWGVLAWTVFYVLDNLSYTMFRVKSGMMLDEASPLDAAIRLFAGRCRTYLGYLIIGAALGHAVEAFWFIVGWAALTAVVHWARVAMLLASRPAA